MHTPNPVHQVVQTSRNFLAAALLLVLFTEASAQQNTQENNSSSVLGELLGNAERIPTGSSWFVALKLPNGVYALWEPGHVEKVNSFLITGRSKHILYDTGMGIDSIRRAVQDVIDHEGLGAQPLMVVNSHNHLDHNGGNIEFDEVWTANEPWGVRRLTEGVPAGPEGGFVGYWQQLVKYVGVTAPDDFAPEAHGIKPYPKNQIRFLEDEDVIDLGDRQLRVIRTFGHSPDGIALFDAHNGLFFGGDTFYGSDYLVSDVELLVKDLERIAPFNIQWHYASHGPQLTRAMQQGRHLAVIRRIIAGEGETQTTSFAGFDLPLQSLDGVTVTVAKDLLLY